MNTTESFNRSNRRARRALVTLAMGGLAFGLAQGAASSLFAGEQAKAVSQPVPNEPPPAELAHAKALSRAFQWAAKKVDPSVVHIAQINKVMMRRSFFERGQMQEQQTGVGTGVIVADNGYILTNNHVVEGAEALNVKLIDDREFSARIIGTDPATDLAVIKIDQANLPTAEWGDSDELEVGEWVIAIGSPFGLSNTVTAGIVSATGRTSLSPRNAPRGMSFAQAGATSFQDFIQTDAAINPGNSGGPLINLDGKVVGINSQIATRSGGSDGIGFSIPTTIARPVMETLIEHGEVKRGWLGVTLGVEPVARNGRVQGVPVAGVVERGPAAAAGLREGDLITKYRGRPVGSENRLRNAIALSRPGTSVELEVLRDGEPKTLLVELDDVERGRIFALNPTEVPRLGIYARTSKGELRRGEEPISGAQMVGFLDFRQTMDPSGLLPSDIIVGVSRRNGEEADTWSVEELSRALKDLRAGERVRLYVIRPMGGGFREGYVDVDVK